MNLAIIPARGGSQRIPRKNIKNFAGIPIIAYSIKAAIESKLFDKIIVSTDDEEIANVAKKYGAEVPFFRPKELADDYTGTNEVIKHAIKWFNEKNMTVDFACCIYATAPFIQLKYLKMGYELLVASERKFAFSVTSYNYPIQRALKMGADGLQVFFPEYINSRSQDLEEAYHDAGQFYWGRSQAFCESAPIFTENSIPIRLPRHLVQDIDTPEDWESAEFMFANLQALGVI